MPLGNHIGQIFFNATKHLLQNNGEKNYIFICGRSFKSPQIDNDTRITLSINKRVHTLTFDLP